MSQDTELLKLLETIRDMTFDKLPEDLKQGSRTDSDDMGHTYTDDKVVALYKQSLLSNAIAYAEQRVKDALPHDVSPRDAVALMDLLKPYLGQANLQSIASEILAMTRYLKEERGVVVTIQNKPLTPLAMGNYIPEITLYPIMQREKK